jgi:flavin-binding protein dodecin
LRVGIDAGIRRDAQSWHALLRPDSLASCALAAYMGLVMSIAKVAEISAQSPNSFDDAVKQGIARASQTIRNIQSAWIKEQQVTIDEQGRITNYRVNMKITFVLDE